MITGVNETDTRYSEAAVNNLPVGSASASLRLALLNNAYPFLQAR